MLKVSLVTSAEGEGVRTEGSVATPQGFTCRLLTLRTLTLGLGLPREGIFISECLPCFRHRALPFPLEIIVIFIVASISLLQMRKLGFEEEVLF